MELLQSCAKPSAHEVLIDYFDCIFWALFHNQTFSDIINNMRLSSVWIQSGDVSQLCMYHCHIVVWHPLHKRFMSSQFKSPKFSSHNIYSNDPIRSQLCTCHESRAVVACAKLWLDWNIIFWISQFKSPKFSCHNIYSNDPIRSQLCTCHDSLAVMACAKLWLDWNIIFWISHVYFNKIRMMSP